MRIVARASGVVCASLGFSFFDKSWVMVAASGDGSCSMAIFKNHDLLM